MVVVRDLDMAAVAQYFPADQAAADPVMGV
jgi:hypothetical protein